MAHKDPVAYKRYHQEYGKRNRQKITARRHGLTLEDYNARVIAQHGVCAICFKPESTVHGGSKSLQGLAIDHDHVTGKVRGLLCSKCNTAVGLLDEDCARAQSLIAYLETHKDA